MLIANTNKKEPVVTIWYLTLPPISPRS